MFQSIIRAVITKNMVSIITFATIVVALHSVALVQFTGVVVTKLVVVVVLAVVVVNGGGKILYDDIVKLSVGFPLTHALVTFVY